MANTLLLKRSSIAGKAPTTANIQYGELSINYTDGNLYYRTNTDTINYFVSNGSNHTANTLSVINGITWASNGVSVLSAATYGNAQVATYLPVYTGNITAGNANIAGAVLAGSGSTSQVAQATGGSLSFSGTNYLTISADVLPIAQTTFTIEAWVYMTSLPTSGTLTALIGGMSPTINSGSWSFGVTNSGKISYYNGTVGVNVTSGTTMVINTWYHIAVVSTAGTTTYYINGVAQTFTGPAGTGAARTAFGSLTMGTYNNGSSTFVGYVKDIRIVSGTAVYTGAFTPPTAPLTAITNTVLLLDVAASGTYLTDSSTNNYTSTNTGSVAFNSSSPIPSTVLVAGIVSTSTTTGALVIAGVGGIGVGGSAYIGGNITAGNITSTLYGTHYGNTIGTTATYTGNITAGNITSTLYGTHYGNTIGTTATYTGTANLGNVITTSGIFWANGVNALASTYGNTQVATYLPVYTGNITAGNANIASTILAGAGGTSTVSVNTGGSLSISGTNYLSVAATPLPQAQTTFTVEAWIYMTSVPAMGGSFAVPGLVGDMTGGGGVAYWSFGPSNSRVLVFDLYGTNHNSSTTTMSLNTWYHIAAVVTSGVLAMYVNGVAQTFDFGTSVGTRSGTTGTLTIGSFNSNACNFNGYIKDLRIVSGTAVYTGAFTPPTAPLTAITNTVLLLNVAASGTYLADSSTNNYVVSATGTPTFNSSNPLPSTTVVTGIVSTSTTTGALVVAGVGGIGVGGNVNATTFYGNVIGTNANISNANIAGAVLAGSGTTTTVVQPIGGSLSFSGTNYLNIPAGGALLPTATTTFTIEAWIYMTSTPAFGGSFSTGALIGDMSTSASSLFWSFGPSNAGKLVFYGGSGQNITTGSSMALNQWYHIAAVSTGGTMTFYINGVAQTFSGPTSQGARASTLNAIVVGTFNNNGCNFIGYAKDLRIATVAVYTGAFTPPTTALATTQSSGTNISAITFGQTLLLLDVAASGTYLTDSSTNNYTSTNTGSVTFNSASPLSTTTIVSGIPSTSTTTGALVVAGGVGVSGSVNATTFYGNTIGTTATYTGNITAGNIIVNGSNLNTSISPTGTGTVTISPAGKLFLSPAGGLSIYAFYTVGTMDNVSVGATTPSTGTFTRLTVNGLNLNTAISPTGSGSVSINPAGGLTISPGSASTIDNTSIGFNTPSTGTFTQLTVNGSNLNTAISPTGTGTVTISPAGALTINPTAASTINNTSIGATTASTGRFTSITTIAGTASVAPINLISGTNLTTASAGAIEYDGAVHYFTPDTTIGRGFVPAISTFRLTTAGGAITTISNVFGTTSNIPLVASAFYEIDIYILALKTTASTAVLTLTNSAAPTLMFVDYEQSPLTGVATPPGSTAALTNINIRGTTTTTTAAYAITTGSLTTGVNHFFRLKLFLNNGTGTSLKIQFTSTSGSITPQAGSVWFARRLPAANTGTFAA